MQSNEDWIIVLSPEVRHNIGGSPLGYFDWTMIQQGVLSGIESVALFGAAAVAMEFCFRRGYISKFPG